MNAGLLPSTASSPRCRGPVAPSELHVASPVEPLLAFPASCEPYRPWITLSGVQKQLRLKNYWLESGKVVFSEILMPFFFVEKLSQHLISPPRTSVKPDQRGSPLPALGHPGPSKSEVFTHVRLFFVFLRKTRLFKLEAVLIFCCLQKSDTPNKILQKKHPL